MTGAFNTKPTVTFPASQAPKQLIEQTLIAGSGTPVASGDTVITNYVGEIWPTKVGSQPKVFDSSFSRGAPTGFVIGTGAVIPGFDKTLVGTRLGTRVLLSIPPADGYGSSGNSQAGIAGTDTLAFVVDLLADYKPNASAPGTADNQLPATGWPKVTSTPGQEPKVTSVAGVTAPAAPTSKLLVKGSGAKIDPSKTLVLQLVQTDIASGAQTPIHMGHAAPTDQRTERPVRRHGPQRSEHRCPRRRSAAGHSRSTGDCHRRGATGYTGPGPDHRRRRAVLTTHSATPLTGGSGKAVPLG